MIARRRYEIAYDPSDDKFVVTRVMAATGSRQEIGRYDDKVAAAAEVRRQEDFDREDEQRARVAGSRVGLRRG